MLLVSIVYKTEIFDRRERENEGQKERNKNVLWTSFYSTWRHIFLILIKLYLWLDLCYQFFWFLQNCCFKNGDFNCLFNHDCRDRNGYFWSLQVKCWKHFNIINLLTFIKFHIYIRYDTTGSISQGWVSNIYCWI